MRRTGMSYSQIRAELRVSKSTLSKWLSTHPLSPERIRELRANSEQRIERCRNAKAFKRAQRHEDAYAEAKAVIGNLSEREMHIAGLFLYWGEGTKAWRDSIACTNTDPAMMRFFLLWTDLLGIPRSKLKVKLHLYADMDISKETLFWSRELNIPHLSFRKPYIKKSLFSGLSYRNSFGHGTCSISYGNARMYERIMMSLRYLREVASR